VVCARRERGEWPFRGGNTKPGRRNLYAQRGLETVRAFQTCSQSHLNHARGSQFFSSAARSPIRNARLYAPGETVTKIGNFDGERGAIDGSVAAEKV